MTCLLLDIEGTVSPIEFVKHTLFPYAGKALSDFVARCGGDPGVRRWLDAAAQDIAGNPDDDEIVRTLQQWIADDRKHTALKALQGMIWKAGFEEGAYVAPIYADAVSFMRDWHARGGSIAIYSSGSVNAQKLLFQYSDAGNLNPLFSHYFDTEIGSKKEPASYRNIIAALDLPAAQIVFCSDVFAELDAASATGIQTVLVDRLQDYPQPRQLPSACAHIRISSFTELSKNSADKLSSA